MEKSGIKKAEQKKKGTIFSLSRYLSVYVKDEDEPAEGENIRGIMMSGYKKDSEGVKHFCNIWIDKNYLIKKRADGNYTLSLSMVDIEVK